MQKTIFFASNNANKQKEVLYYQKLYQLNNVHFQSIADLPIETQKQYDPKEKYYTFNQNAKVKAQDLYNLIQKPVISEDSGILVEYLDDKPGVHSARIANTDKERNHKILKQLEKVPIENRNAYFLSCICYMDGYANCLFFYGRVKGRIHSQELGKNGFGYDPIFYFPKLKKTFGEISQKEKLQYSHRGQALKLLSLYLKNI